MYFQKAALFNLFEEGTQQLNRNEGKPREQRIKLSMVRLSVL